MSVAALRQRFWAREFHQELRWQARILPRTIVTRHTVVLFGRIPGRTRHHPRTTSAQLSSGITVRIHRPRTATSGGGAALLWIHGGGYVLGSAAMDDSVCRRYADELGVLVVAVDYRLAPDHRYPAALEDCYEALTWLSARSEVDPTRIAVVGASAGGGLVATLAQAVHDRRKLVLAGQVLLYPMLDDRAAARQDHDAGLRRMWNAASGRLCWRAYLADTDPALAVPARRADLGGLAPAWIGVGDLDILYDEAHEYADRLAAHGVQCHLEVVEGAFHGFDAVAPKAQVSQYFFRSQCTMLRSVLGIESVQS